jgi:hypothetical protein
MKALRVFTLYFVPGISILIFGFYTLTAGWGDPDAWGAAHGVHRSIVLNYRWVNAVTLTGWVFTLISVLRHREMSARLVAACATAYVLCDIVYYIPMARLAGEAFPFNQFAIFVVQAVYALYLPSLMRNRAVLGKC